MILNLGFLFWGKNIKWQFLKYLDTVSKGPILCNKKRVLYSFFWVNPPHLNFMCSRFRTLSCVFKPPMEMEQTECCTTSTHKFQMSGIHPKERIQQEKRNCVDYRERGRETRLWWTGLMHWWEGLQVNAEFWCENLLKCY